MSIGINHDPRPRLELEQQVAEYLAGGGKIKVIPFGQSEQERLRLEAEEKIKARNARARKTSGRGVRK